MDRFLRRVYVHRLFLIYLIGAIALLYLTLAFDVVRPMMGLILLSAGMMAILGARIERHQQPRRMVTSSPNGNHETVNSLERRLKRELASMQRQLGSGISPYEIVVRQRKTLEELHRALIIVLNRGRDRFGQYAVSMRRILGRGSNQIEDWEFQNMDWARLVDQYWNRIKKMAAERLSAINAVNLSRPRGKLPVLYEHPRWGILLPAGKSLVFSELPAPRTKDMMVTDRKGNRVALRLERLSNSDLKEVAEWRRPQSDSEVDYDLDQLLQTGLVEGEYGCKLTDNDNVIVGIVVLVALESHVHLHITYVNPHRLPKIEGLGNDLGEEAKEDARHRQVKYVTTFPTNKKSQRKNQRLGFRRVAVNGVFSSDMWVAFVDDPPNSDRRAVEYLPGSGSYDLVPAMHEGWGRRFKLHDVSYTELENVMVDRASVEHFGTDVPSFRREVVGALPSYWNAQKDQPSKPIILKRDADGRWEAGPAPRPKKSSRMKLVSLLLSVFLGASLLSARGQTLLLKGCPPQPASIVSANDSPPKRTWSWGLYPYSIGSPPYQEVAGIPNVGVRQALDRYAIEVTVRAVLGEPRENSIWSREINPRSNVLLETPSCSKLLL